MKRPWLSTASGFALVIALAAGAAAQDNAGREDVVVVTGTAIETLSAETLQNVDVISLDDVVDSFDGSLGASLARLPGISTTSFGPAVGRPIIRGFGGDRVRILNNGVGLVDASGVSVDHATTTEVLDAEQIIILRGPAAIAYGGGAIGGVINVIDGRIPTRPVDGLFEGQAYAGYSSVDRGHQEAARIRAGVGPLVFQFEASHREAGDFDIPGYAESPRLRALEEAEHDAEHGEEDHEHEEEEEVRGTVPNSGLTFDTIGAGASLIGDWGFLGISVRNYDAEYGLPAHEHHHEDDEHEEHEDDEQEDEHEDGDPKIAMEQTRWDIRGQFNFQLGPFDHLDISSGIADYQHVELEPDGEIGTLFESDGWEARAALVNGHGESRWTGSVGIQMLQTELSASGEEAFIPPVSTHDVGIFAAQRYDLEGYGFDMGARVERRELDTAIGPDRSFDTVSLAAGAFLRPADGMFLGLSLARTERAPTDAELYSDGLHAATGTVEIGNSNLSKETGWALDGTFRWSGNGWRLETGAFYSHFSDFIYLAPTGLEDPDEDAPIYRYLQDDATLWGGELYLERDLAQIGPWALVGDFTLEYVQGETDSFGSLPRMPPLSTTIGAEFQREVVDLRGEIVWAADQDDTAGSELPTDGYTMVNLSAVAHPFGSDTRLILEARNITDEEGRLHTSQLKDTIPLPGRSFRIAILQRF
ncbi:TonB-dependent receptor [Maricaulis salignorans]|uniref:TonB-dependent receptor n=1 Tax=Maricaulis salignorans TaxID=144026 RepID=UPI003A8E3B20